MRAGAVGEISRPHKFERTGRRLTFGPHKLGRLSKRAHFKARALFSNKRSAHHILLPNASTCKPILSGVVGDVDYCPDTFGDLFAIDATSQYDQFDPDCLSERLNFLTNTARRLGFMSLQDAALADAEQYEVDDSTRKRLQEFSVAGCHERLIALLFDRDVLETDGQHRLDIPACIGNSSSIGLPPATLV